MKNLITKRWEAPSDRARDGLAWANGEGPAAPLAEADKAVVRENLLEAMIFAPSVIRAQLGLCLRRIAGADFPERWPSLLPAVVANLQQQEEQRLSGALAALRVLCRVYEFKPEDARPRWRARAHAPHAQLGAISRRAAALRRFHIVEQTFPLTLRLIQAVLQAAPAVNKPSSRCSRAKSSGRDAALAPAAHPPARHVGGVVRRAARVWSSRCRRTRRRRRGARGGAVEAKKRCAQIAHRLFSRYGPQQTFSGPLKPQYEAFAAGAAGAAAHSSRRTSRS